MSDKTASTGLQLGIAAKPNKCSGAERSLLSETNKKARTRAHASANFGQYGLATADHERPSGELPCKQRMWLCMLLHFLLKLQMSGAFAPNKSAFAKGRHTCKRQSAQAKKKPLPSRLLLAHRATSSTLLAASKYRMFLPFPAPLQGRLTPRPERCPTKLLQVCEGGSLQNPQAQLRSLWRTVQSGCMPC